MSKKSAAAIQKSAAKRNARAKAKSASAAKAKQTPMGQAKRKMRGLNIGGNNNFDAVLNQAVRQIKKGGNVSGPAFNSTEEVMDGIVKAAGETFKLFCYNAVAKELVEEGAIEHNFRIDLNMVGEGMMLIDNRVTTLRAYINSPEADEAVIGTEALEIGTLIQNYADELYEEIARMEEHSLIIEETIARLANEVPEGSESERRARVLTTIAYKLLAAIKLQLTPSQVAAENETPADEVVAEENVTKGESLEEAE